MGTFLGFLTIPARQQSRQNQPPPNVGEIVLRAAAEAKRYRDEFKNLLAKETKTIRVFDKSENLKKERTIVSNFLVYESMKHAGDVTEFRNVLSVDGKPIENADERAVEFFERVLKAKSSESELEKIAKESLRFDTELQIAGLTLFQGIALDDRVRDSFVFEVVGRENSGNSDAYVLRYRQSKPSALIWISDKPAGPAVLDYAFDLGNLKGADPRLGGTLWIDTTTFQILREIRHLSIQPIGFDAPVTIASNDLEYSTSEFGLHTPRRIVHVQFRLDAKKKQVTKEVEYTATYSDFVRPRVEVKSDKPN